MGDTTSAYLAQAFDGRHQISMDKDGPRKGFTSIVAPTNIQFQVLSNPDNITSIKFWKPSDTTNQQKRKLQTTNEQNNKKIKR